MITTLQCPGACANRAGFGADGTTSLILEPMPDRQQQVLYCPDPECGYWTVLDSANAAGMTGTLAA